VASERVSYKSVNTLPESQLDLAAWLSWYNNVELDTPLRFAVP
jgi:hypothetical protein